MDYNSFKNDFSKFILSASGFRKIFAAGGDEESPLPGISPNDAAAAVLIAEEFRALAEEQISSAPGPGDGKSGRPVAAVGMDARPTGPAIAQIICAVLDAAGFEVRYAGIIAAPELMAWVKTEDDIDYFAYITASHNPIGHNGFKFGFAGGAVLGGAAAARFIARVKAAASDEPRFRAALEFAAGFDRAAAGAAAGVGAGAGKWKAAAEEAYRRFSYEVITAEGEPALQKPVTARIRKASSAIGIIAELNGSARGVSIDRAFFDEYGIKTRFLNDVPGRIVHSIVPEGASLDLCREELDKAHIEDPAFILGYVPDNDGDRGNIVYYNDDTGRAEILEAQEVFALSVKSELSFMRLSHPDARLGVAVNGPTSMRIEQLAAEYGAGVFRAEVGEANVVDLAAEKRTEGWLIRILGEGSNGGNITHPASVRDPLNTIFALIKLIAFGGFASITEAVNSLPPFTTTSAFAPEAKMNIGTITHARLKANYEAAFPAQFEAKRPWLSDSFGITGWYEVNYEGTSARRGTGSGFRSGDETGGLKIVLTAGREESREAHRDAGFLWMRGSGTEPVFRVMTDIEGTNPEGMRALLSWQREMVAAASDNK